MLYHLHKPGPPLSQFVQVLWLFEGYRITTHERERLLPDGSVEMVINLLEDRCRIYPEERSDRFESLKGSLICGPHSRFFIIDADEQEQVMGVHFKPGGAFPFLGLPADELLNLHVSLEDLWGTAASELREQLLAAETAEKKFRILETTLLSRLKRGHHPAVAFAIEHLQCREFSPSVSWVTDQIGLSSKRFIDLFKTEVGLTPKLFSRVQRFQSIIRRAAMQEHVAWTNLALDCGYFDQAHFIHDFRAFSGINPTAYLERRTPHLNHVPLTNDH